MPSYCNDYYNTEPKQLQENNCKDLLVFYLGDIFYFEYAEDFLRNFLVKRSSFSSYCSILLKKNIATFSHLRCFSRKNTLLTASINPPSFSIELFLSIIT